MALERDVFSISGPIHLTAVDWNCPHHRRSIAASLVQAVYILERDQQENRQGSEALAPAWWQFFHFDLIRTLVDDDDHSIFGATFKLRSNVSIQNPTNINAPKLVVAFKGTLTKKEINSRDLTLDLHLIPNGLHYTARDEIAKQVVHSTVSIVGSSNVWLVGHSLSASMATRVGKHMARCSIFLDAFLFNPPFFSERIEDQKVKHRLRLAGKFITAGLSLAIKGKQASPNVENSFAMLSPWVPCLFVNPNDHICSEYICYFQHRATRNSIRGLVLGAFRKESEPVHLLSSANLTVNLSPSPGSAHGIHQWWQPTLHLETMEYKY